MLMPPVSRYMTRGTVTVDADDRMIDAHELMRAHHFRHLPVIDNGRVVGVVSERDLHLLQHAASVDLYAIPVREAMSEPAFAVAPAAPLDEVVEQMHDRRCGSAIVVGATGVEGIFTTTDALRAFADVLHRAAD